MTDRGGGGLRITRAAIRALAAMPDRVEDAARALEAWPEAGPEFMDSIATGEPFDDAAVRTIDVKLWTDGRIICDVHFAGGVRLGDMDVSTRAPLPATMVAGLIGRRARDLVDHPILEGMRVASDQDGSRTVRLEDAPDVDLGEHPSEKLRALVAAEIGTRRDATENEEPTP